MTIRDLPRGVRIVLEATLPGDWRDDILRDLEEAWSRRRADRGAVAARLWLWSQCILFALRFLPERLRDLAGDGFWRSTDAKLAVRSLAKAPLIGVLAVVSLGVGVGAAVTGFTFIQGAFFTHLPFPGGERIVLVEDYDRVARSSVGVR
ncbi:MAG: hypothetical protein R3253_03615, partial [Longimicrobiales bacterium]|nr:hypothetical protein [Longimicrobiales bacterium]